MKNLEIINDEKLVDESKYKFIEEGIYLDVKEADGCTPYRLAMSMELEDGDDDQYPLEDILDKYLIHVEDFLDSEEGIQKYIFGGKIDDLRSLKSIVGKRVRNKEIFDKNGDTSIGLVIE